MKHLTAAVIAASFAAATAHVAHAQPTATSPTLTAPMNERPSHRKSEKTATALAIAGTVAPLALLVGAGLAETVNQDGVAIALGVTGGVGVIVGPSAGHWYAGKAVTTGMGIRAASVTVGFAGLVMAGLCANADEDRSVNGGCNAAPYVVTTLAGLAGYVTGVVYDVATAGRAVRAANERHDLRMSVMPTAVRTSTGLTPGLAAVGSF